MTLKSFKVIKLTIFLLIITNLNIIAYSVPAIWAQAFIAIDSDSGRIIASRNADVKLPMASTTKIMTTILSIDKIKNLNTTVEIPDYCTGIEGSSLYLRPKQKVTVIDLLYGTMLRSGNDAALAIANTAANNNIDKFIEMMNEKAIELGAYNTNFVNPNGLHDDNHYTTAYDLALISKYAMENKIFKEIASSKMYKANSLNTVLYNKNKVVHQYDYGNGIKIGYTRAAGRCLVASAEKDDTEIIVVVLNDNSWFQDSYKLFDWAFENYKNYNIVDKDQFVCYTDDGNPVFTDTGFNYLLTEEEKNNLHFRYNLSIPHLINDKKKPNYGTFDILIGNDIIYTGNLVGE